MIRRTGDVSAEARAAYHQIIDVRSPAEFAEDHLPGAVNLPVLDDAERAEIGTIYVQQSKFLARRLGAAKVARNIAAHLDGALKNRDGGFKPLVHCWRGGQRSGAMAEVMDQVGWPVTVLEGGYQTWRRAVVAALYDTSPPFEIVLLDGPTGSGKTALLHGLAQAGVQTLDLEGLAAHRGSLFGATATPQPSQKLFESRLFAAMEGVDPARPVVVEAESSRIGQRTLPAAVWAAMCAASVVEIAVSRDARVAHTTLTYADIAADAERLDQAIGRLPRHHAKTTIAEWRAMARRGEIATLARDLMEQHYDPAYRRQAQSRKRKVRGRVEVVDLEAAGQARAVAEIAALIGG